VNGSSRGWQPTGAKPGWYAVWTRSHCEHVVAQQLSSKGFEVFLPEIDTWSRRAGETRLIRVPLFAGYLFVRTAIDKQRHLELLTAHGVVRVLGESWDRLATIPDAEVEALQRVLAARLPVLPHAHLASGDRVTVVDGPLAGVEGIFIHDRPQKGRLVLSIDLLGRSVAVEVDCAAVVPCSIRNVA
jgi:transcription termination/antitermination protein NusG